MRIVLLALHLSRHSGGLAASVPPLARTLADREGLDVHIVGLRDPLSPEDWRDWGPQVHPADPRGPRRFGWAPALRRVLDELDPDVTDVQGVWMYLSVANRCHTRRSHRPYVVTPRGMLDAWAVAHHRWRKRLVGWLFEYRHLQRASCLRATSEMEARYIRAFGLRNPIAVIPNGVELPQELPPSKADQPTVVYLGRLHPKKNLEVLLRAWQAAERQRPDWQLRIVGPDEGDYRRRLEQLARALGLARVIFPGPVPPPRKWQILAKADLVVLPTHSENFGMVVAEALASGTPVIVSRGAPWDAVERVGCGWWVEPEVEAFARALLEATEAGRERLAAMGRAGRAYVEREFAWSNIAERMEDLYRWVVGGGVRPSFVVTN